MGSTGGITGRSMGTSNTEAPTCDDPSMRAPIAPTLRVARRAGLAAGAVAATSGLLVTALATYFTRRVVTPDHVKPDDVQVLDVDLDATPPTVTLARTDDTAVDGRYGLWWGGREGHAR